MIKIFNFLRIALGRGATLASPSRPSWSRVDVHLTEREIVILFQGCDKKGKAPNGRTYAEVAEKTEIREMLQQ